MFVYIDDNDASRLAKSARRKFSLSLLLRPITQFRAKFISNCARGPRSISAPLQLARDTVYIEAEKLKLRSGRRRATTK